jgi:hypothetical protein
MAKLLKIFRLLKKPAPTPAPPDPPRPESYGPNPMTYIGGV